MIADESDRASAFEETDRALRLLEHDSKKEKPPANFDGLNCVEEDCGLEIEPERIHHGYFRCFNCQSNRELRNKFKGSQNGTR